MAAKHRLSIRYIDDNIVLSKTEAWTYMRVPTVSYEFLSFADRKTLALRMFLSLSALVSGTKPVDVHFITTTRPIPVDLWANGLDERVQKWNPAPGWPRYREQTRDYLRYSEFSRKEVFIGVKLGNRGVGSGANKANGKQKLDLLDPFKKIMSFAENKLQLEDEMISNSEINYWTTKANEIQRSLGSSHIQALPVNPNVVAWLISKALYPDMVVPEPSSITRQAWGPGEIQSLTEGVVRPGHRFIEVEQLNPNTNEVEKGYSATLCFSRFPDSLQFPNEEPWMHYASSLAFPVDLFTRMTLVPSQKVQQDVVKKLADTKDQAMHIATSGQAIPLNLQEQYDKATAVEYLIQKDRVPWIYARHRMIVSAHDKDELASRIRKVIEHYKDLNIDVSWPTGDQFDLFLEGMPGEKVRSSAYYQRQELILFAGGMANASSEVGDNIEISKDGRRRGWIGQYIGETTSRVRCMVNFSPHVAMTRNFPPGVAITGSPGGGKSFFAFTLAYQMAMQGVWTIYIDPKADAIPMAQMQGLGKPQLFDLRDGNDGMLDPFSLGEKESEKILLALETLRLLLGGDLRGDRETALVLAVEKVAKSRNPSLYQVVEELVHSENSEAQNLGHVLRLIRELPFSRLCFSSRGSMNIRPEDGLTVITLLGLDLPDALTEPEDYSYENRLAVSVMYLLTRYARSLMLSMNKDHPKAICIDEAWAITSTKQGAKLIPEIARMGRSHNTALVLVSQNAGDLMKEAVTNSISSVFAFRSKNPTEIDNVLELLGMVNNDPHQTTIRELNNGECIMRDVDGRLARVQIDSWNEEMKTAFDTNPETRGKKN